MSYKEERGRAWAGKKNQSVGRGTDPFCIAKIKSGGKRGTTNEGGEENNLAFISSEPRNETKMAEEIQREARFSLKQEV